MKIICTDCSTNIEDRCYCSKCLEDAKEDAFERGKAEGYTQGLADGEQINK